MDETPKVITAVIILIVGFAVAGLLYTFVSVISGQTFEIVEDDIAAINSYTDANITITPINQSWVSLNNTDIRVDTLYIYNSTTMNNEVGNFTVNHTTGYVFLDESWEEQYQLSNTTAYAIYQYDDGLIRSAIQSGILSTFEANQEIADYMPIIVLAIIITLVIGLIIGGIASKFMGPSMFYRYENQGLL